jgi:hypothetical protein
VRFNNDPEWGDGCRNARLGIWTSSFVDLINSRVIHRREAEKGELLTLNGTIHTFVTVDSITRQGINNLFVKTTALCLPEGEYPVRVVAYFKGKLKRLSRSDIQMIMQLPDNKFSGMAPFLDLVPGMPVQVTQNVRAEKLVANETLGMLEKIVF